MYWHYFIIAVCIFVIIIFQIKIYRKTTKKRKQFEGIFPDNAEEEWLVLKKDGVQIVSKKLSDDIAEKAELEKNIERTKISIEAVQKIIDRYEHFKANASENTTTSRYDETINNNKQKKKELNSTLTDYKRRLKEIKDDIEALNNLDKTLQNATRKEIIDSINRYLDKNKDGVTDFNLIRDIIDRNCDAIEEEIQTQIPIPLYFGLMGTMLGILVGVGALTFSGTLKNLLTSFEAPQKVVNLTKEDLQLLEASPVSYELSYSDLNREITEEEVSILKHNFNEKASNGISDLFGGIALAMISSIIGIILTTLGSWTNKNTKALVEQKKHTFISWLQAELLPKISTDLSSAIIQLGHDLSGFNSTFSGNANLLKQTISEISRATTAQASLLNSIERLDIARIAQANIAVYEQLKNCTDDIANLAKDLREIQSNIRGIGQFMENGINEYERRNTYIQDASGKVDIAVQQGQELLSQRANEIFAKYDELLHTLYMRSETTTRELAQKYDVEAEKLHRAIVEKLTDVKQIETELKNLVAVKTSINNLEKATTEQNRKIDSLANAIGELAQVKVSGGTTHVEMKMPTLYKVIIIVSGSILSLTGLFFITLRILEIFGITL